MHRHRWQIRQTQKKLSRCSYYLTILTIYFVSVGTANDHDAMIFVKP
jgi:hypothetical protein